MFKRIAVIALHHPEDPHLILHGVRKDNGLFAMPGGHINDGENASDGAARELKEETGLDGVNLEHRLDHIYESPDHVNHVSLFMAQAPSEIPTTALDPDGEFVPGSFKFINPLMCEQLHVPEERNIFCHWAKSEAVGHELEKDGAIKSVQQKPNSTPNYKPQLSQKSSSHNAILHSHDLQPHELFNDSHDEFGYPTGKLILKTESSLNFEGLVKAKKDMMPMFGQNPEQHHHEFADWASKALPNKDWQIWAARNYKKDPASFTPEVKETLEHFGGSTHIPEVSKIRFDKTHDLNTGISAFKDAEDSYNKRIGEKLNVVKPDPGTKKILDLGNGRAWYSLGRGSCSAEGKAMGHCGNVPSEKEGDRVLSLRTEHKDSKGNVLHEPHATFIVNGGYLGEMKGRGNTKPGQKYHQDIASLLLHHKIKGIVGGGYLHHQNFNIEDLNPEQKGKILAQKPNINVYNADEIPEDLPEKFHKEIEPIINYRKEIKSKHGDNWREGMLEGIRSGEAPKMSLNGISNPTDDELHSIIQSNASTDSKVQAAMIGKDTARLHASLANKDPNSLHYLNNPNVDAILDTNNPDAIENLIYNSSLKQKDIDKFFNNKNFNKFDKKITSALAQKEDLTPKQINTLLDSPYEDTKEALVFNNGQKLTPEQQLNLADDSSEVVRDALASQPNLSLEAQQRLFNRNSISTLSRNRNLHPEMFDKIADHAINNPQSLDSENIIENLLSSDKVPPGVIEKIANHDSNKYNEQIFQNHNTPKPLFDKMFKKQIRTKKALENSTAVHAALNSHNLSEKQFDELKNSLHKVGNDKHDYFMQGHKFYKPTKDDIVPGANPKLLSNYIGRLKESSPKKYNSEQDRLANLAVFDKQSSINNLLNSQALDEHHRTQLLDQLQDVDDDSYKDTLRAELESPDRNTKDHDDAFSRLESAGMDPEDIAKEIFHNNQYDYSDDISEERDRIAQENYPIEDYFNDIQRKDPLDAFLEGRQGSSFDNDIKKLIDDNAMKRLQAEGKVDEEGNYSDDDLNEAYKEESGEMASKLHDAFVNYDYSQFPPHIHRSLDDRRERLMDHYYDSLHDDDHAYDQAQESITEKMLKDKSMWPKHLQNTRWIQNNIGAQTQNNDGGHVDTDHAGLDEPLAASELNKQELAKTPLMTDAETSQGIGDNPVSQPQPGGFRLTHEKTLNNGLKHKIYQETHGFGGLDPEIVHHIEHPNGNRLAEVRGSMNGDAFQVHSSHVDPGHKGHGYGKMAYTGALLHHGKMISDEMTSEPANNAWLAVKRLTGAKGTISPMHDPAPHMLWMPKSDRERIAQSLYHDHNEELAASELDKTSLEKTPIVSDEYEQVNWPQHPSSEGTYHKTTIHKPTGTKIHSYKIGESGDHSGTIYAITENGGPTGKPIAKLQINHTNLLNDEYDPHYAYGLTDPQHRGKGLGTLLHLAALRDYKSLKSDSRLSPGSQRVYEKLSQHPKVKAKLLPVNESIQENGLTAFPQETQHELRYKKPQKLAASEKVGNKICMPKKDFVKEHNKLVDVLRHPSKEKLNEEADEQSSELQELDKVREDVRGITTQKLKQLKQDNYQNPDTGLELDAEAVEDELNRRHTNRGDKLVNYFKRQKQKLKQSKDLPEDFFGKVEPPKAPPAPDMSLPPPEPNKANAAAVQRGAMAGGPSAAEMWNNLKTGFGLDKDELDKGQNGDWQKEGYRLEHGQDRDGFHNVTAYDKHSNPVGYASFSGHYIPNEHNTGLTSDPAHMTGWNVEIHPAHQRKGLASAMYRLAEEKSGKKILQGGTTPEGSAFWSQPNRPFGKDEFEKEHDRLVKELEMAKEKPVDKANEFSGGNRRAESYFGRKRQLNLEEHIKRIDQKGGAKKLLEDAVKDIKPFGSKPKIPEPPKTEAKPEEIKKADPYQGSVGNWKAEGYKLYHQAKDGLHTVVAHDPQGKPVGILQAEDLGDGTIQANNVKVHPHHKNRRIATGMYDLLQRKSGLKAIPDLEAQTKSAQGFWKHYGKRQEELHRDEMPSVPKMAKYVKSSKYNGNTIHTFHEHGVDGKHSKTHFVITHNNKHTGSPIAQSTIDHSNPEHNLHIRQIEMDPNDTTDLLHSYTLKKLGII